MNETRSFVQPAVPPGEGSEENKTPPPPQELCAAGVPEKLPRLFGGYELLEVVGRGGMGVVYKACQKSLNRLIALKMIGPGRLSSDSALRRFCQEAEAAARLDHPNIVSVYEFGTQEGQPFFTMAYVQGSTLHKRVQAGALPSLAETLSYMRELVDAIAFAHQQGIIHRDLKPANVLIDSQGRPRLVDFGLAKYCAAEADLAHHTLNGEVLGTPAYMAPEQAQGDPARVGPLVDVYGLGGLLYFLLTGRAPFAGVTVEQVLYRVLQEQPVPPSRLNPLVPAELEAICLKCLHKDPASRYPSARALGEALARVSLSGVPAVVGAQSTLDARPAPRRGKRRLAGLVLLCLSVLLLAGLSLDNGWFKPTPSARKAGVLEATRKDFGLEVTLLGARGEEDGAYRLVVGDDLKVRVKVDQDAYVGIWTIEPDKAGGTVVVQLFPNKHEKDHLLKAGQERTVPDWPIQVGLSLGPESDQLWVVATAERWEPNFASHEGNFVELRTKMGRPGVIKRWMRLVEPMAETVLPYRVAPAPRTGPRKKTNTSEGENMDQRTTARLLRPALLAVLALLPAQPAPGQPGPASSQDLAATLGQAETLYQADRPLQAAPLYEQVLAGSHGKEVRLCSDRLLAIYIRAGRYDRAIQVGKRYAPWLEHHKDFTRLRDLTEELGSCYLWLGHFSTAQALLQQALQDRQAEPLAHARRLLVRGRLALTVEKMGDRTGGGRLWKEVEEQARALLDGQPPLEARQQIDCARRLADSYRFQDMPAKALPYLQRVLPLHDQLKDPLGKCETLKLLGEQHLASKEPQQAEKVLRQALELHRQTAPDDRLFQGDLARILAETMRSQGRGPEARTWREQAVKDYEAVLKGAADPVKVLPTTSLAAYWRLHQLFQKHNLHSQALRLTLDQSQQWSGGLVLEPRMKAEEGSLRVLLDASLQARAPLRQAVAQLEAFTPLNLVELPRALNNLALVELTSANLVRAEELGQRCLELYRRYRLQDDLVLMETIDLLGVCSAYEGNYPRAIERFRDGVARCVRLGTKADPQRGNLLLNLALLHKAQGSLDETLTSCSQAGAIFRSLTEPDDYSLAAFAAAELSLFAAQGKFAQADERAREVLQLCARHGVQNGPLKVTARHCQALGLLHARKHEEAGAVWREVRAWQEEERQSLLLPRTLNYLALTEEFQGHLDRAEQLYREARKLQHDNPRVFPVTHLITLWRLANVLARLPGSPPRKGGEIGGESPRSLLNEALGVMEKARLQIYGDAKQRVAFFAEAAPVLEQLVDWSFRDGNPEDAFTVFLRGRSRALLDQLQLARVDPRAGLPADKADLLRQEEQHRRRISTLQARVLFGEPVDLGKELEEARAAYAAVWREILNASPVYRQLEDQDNAARALPLIRDNVLGPRRMLLAYWVGRERSYLLLQSGTGARPEMFPLQIPARVAARLLPQTRPAAGPGAQVPVGQVMLRTLVDRYLAQIETPTFDRTRGLRLKGEEEPAPGAVPVPIELLGDLVLPAGVRERIRAEAPECLVVIPDGPLHRLPLEALLISAAPAPRYVLDELPPLVYAPLAALLLQQGESTPAVPRWPLSLLTVGNPVYPKRPQPTKAEAQPAPFLSLPELPSTAQESQRIRRLFDSRQVTALEQAAATKRAVLAALPEHQVVHLAVHGFADERFGNLFGALAFSPGQGPEPANQDGLLALHEIYQLKLRNCELAVLSACVTHVGPQPPLEAGVTLAGAFLTAGARRVVASQWSVADESTAVLMETFFQEVTAAARKDEPIPYARALQKARQQVRKQDKRWETPYFWAPFVLLGMPG